VRTVNVTDIAVTNTARYFWHFVLYILEKQDPLWAYPSKNINVFTEILSIWDDRTEWQRIFKHQFVATSKTMNIKGMFGNPILYLHGQVFHWRSSIKCDVWGSERLRQCVRVCFNVKWLVWTGRWHYYYYQQGQGKRQGQGIFLPPCNKGRGQLPPWLRRLWVYKMKSRGLRTNLWGTPTGSWNADDLDVSILT